MEEVRFNINQNTGNFSDKPVLLICKRKAPALYTEIKVKGMIKMRKNSITFLINLKIAIQNPISIYAKFMHAKFLRNIKMIHVQMRLFE